MNNSYGCEDKEYLVKYFPDFVVKKDADRDTDRDAGRYCFETSYKIYGTIINFNPNGQTAILDTNGNLYYIDSRLIYCMRPIRTCEKKFFLKNETI